MSNAASYVGANASGVDGGTFEPIRVPENLLKAAAAAPKAAGATISPLLELDTNQLNRLKDYLVSRLSSGLSMRDSRLKRMGDIDRAISTWQQLSPEDTERKRLEDVTGKTMALPINLPILATHLDDLVSYFAEALAPVANPFFSAKGETSVAALQAQFNTDAISRDYYSQLASTIRDMLKYNLGGMRVRWDKGESLDSMMSEAGNEWNHLDAYNVLWDPTVKNPKRVAKTAEWAAYVETVNRLTLMRKALNGEYVLLDDLLSGCEQLDGVASAYKEAQIVAGISPDGSDGKTAAGTSGVNWQAYGLGGAKGATIDGYELTEMYCWLIPAQFGLLTNDERAQIEGTGRMSDSFLELWRFELLGNCRLISAAPAIDREMWLGNEPVEIPYYISFMTQDQLKESQRSTMELMKGFQSFASNMYNIFIQGMRKNVWGMTGYDSTMFDMSQVPKGEVVGIVPMRGMPGRDARAGLVQLNQTSGVEGAMGVVSNTLQLKDQLFPSQAMPSQIAGMDRAIKSQVSAVTQGSQRSMKTVLRIMDSSLMLPTRMEAFRNYRRNKVQAATGVTNEVFSKLIGSGIESMEAERVSEALWQLLYAIVQNSEAMQYYDVPKLLSYIGNVGNLSVDLGQFVRQQPTQEGGGDPTQQPVPAA